MIAAYKQTAPHTSISIGQMQKSKGFIVNSSPFIPLVLNYPEPLAQRFQSTNGNLSGAMDELGIEQPAPELFCAPQDPLTNLLYRRAVLERCEKDPIFAQRVRAICKVNLRFFIETFVYTEEPRPKGQQSIIHPWICYPYQFDFLKLSEPLMGNRDIVVAKSRDMGASWVSLIRLFHWWLFKPHSRFLLISRTADCVYDKTGDSLFGKLKFIADHLPSFLRPRFNLTEMKMENLDNGAMFTGAATTEMAGVGGRATCAIIDEAAQIPEGQFKTMIAKLAPVTDCRIFISTFHNRGPFYALAQNKSFIRFNFHWTSHPNHSKGLYWSNGKPRSPYYDDMCGRMNHDKRLIAQELDMDPDAADPAFFGWELVEKMRAAADANPPSIIGELDYDSMGSPGAVTPISSGRFKFWSEFDITSTPAFTGPCVVGVDVSAGTGSSNTCMSVIDCGTGRKIGQFSDAMIQPHEAARLAASVGRLFGNAQIIWEHMGPGVMFCAELLNIQYPNIFTRRNVDRPYAGTDGQAPGFVQTRSSKNKILGDMKSALQTGRFIMYSPETATELAIYKYDDNGEPYCDDNNVDDTTGARSAHGDHVMADALAWHALTLSPSFGRLLRKKSPEQLLAFQNARSINDPSTYGYFEARRNVDAEYPWEMAE